MKSIKTTISDKILDMLETASTEPDKKKFNTKPEKNIVLGKEYKDSLHGFKGIAVSICHYLTGCSQVQLEYLKNGDEIHSMWFDITRIEGLEVEPVPGGPQDHPASKY